MSQRAFLFLAHIDYVSLYIDEIVGVHRKKRVKEREARVLFVVYVRVFHYSLSFFIMNPIFPHDRATAIFVFQTCNVFFEVSIYDFYSFFWGV